MLRAKVIQMQKKEIESLKLEIESLKNKGLEHLERGFILGFERAKVGPYRNNAQGEWLHMVELHGLKKNIKIIR